MKDKRYVVSVDMYVYADNDKEAIAKAHNIVDRCDEEDSVSHPKVQEIGEQGFGSFEYRPVKVTPANESESF